MPVLPWGRPVPPAMAAKAAVLVGLGLAGIPPTPVRMAARSGRYPYYCVYHGARGGKGMAGMVIVEPAAPTSGERETGGALQGAASAGGGTAPALQPTSLPPPPVRPKGPYRTLRVPENYPTIQAAVDAAQPGDLILVSPGVYREEVTVTTPFLTIRGLDRNRVILDGEFRRSNGVKVLV